MHPLKTITQISALGGLALTGYGFIFDTFGIWETFTLTVFFFWSFAYAQQEMTI